MGEHSNFARTLKQILKVLKCYSANFVHQIWQNRVIGNHEKAMQVIFFKFIHFMVLCIIPTNFR